MERGSGQQYAVNVFGRGIAQDINHDLPMGQVRDTYIQANRLAVNQDLINGLRAVNGDTLAYTLYSGNTSFDVLATYEMGGYLYSFIIIASVSIRIYRDATLIGESSNYPGTSSNGYLYIDGNPDSGELAITDGIQIPIILDVDDMYAQTVTGSATTYTTDYDKTLYEVNQDIHLTQPIFRRLNNVGVGGGVLSGSYSYAYRLVSDNGDETAWSPPTPFIPVPSSYGAGGEPNYVPGAKTYGEAASLNATKYGIDIAFRVVNYSGFDYVEIKRIPNNVGAQAEYTATPQYTRLPSSISETTISIINFTDIASIDWAILDESNIIDNSIIATARTVRFYDNRLVLGGVTYETRLFNDTDVFVDVSGTSVQGTAYKDDLGIPGYTDIQNQVYKKSQRLGERYSYAIVVNDSAHTKSFALPYPDLINYKFPERRTNFSGGDNAVTAATTASDTAAVTFGTYEVYRQGSRKKQNTKVSNIIYDSVDDYGPITPTSRTSADDYGLALKTCDIVDGSAPDTGTAYEPTAYGHSIIATGMKLGGFDTTKLPSWADGISVVRSDPAGRVVAQGIATYALAAGLTGVSKSKDKIWLYSPELDSVIGDKPGVFDDIIANPEDYQIQLVSPVGFFPEYYSGSLDNYGTSGIGIDFLTNAMAYYSSDHINPYDSDALTGRGDGYVTFGRWRNQVNQGAGIDASNDYIFDIDAAEQAVVNNYEGKLVSGRNNYLEVTLAADLYYQTALSSLPGDPAGVTDAIIRTGHEPFYVVNIIKNGAMVSDNNTDIFKEIGHHIKLNSLIGVGNGYLDQSMEITSERVADFHWSSGSGGAYLIPNASDEYGYIWVNGQRWLNVTHWRDVDIDVIRGSWVSGTGFTQTSNGGDACETSYGIFDVVIVNGVYNIVFPYQTTGGVDIIPGEGEEVEVRYDNTRPIDLLLGDVVIAPAAFLPIDAKMKTLSAGARLGLHMNASFPFQTFQFDSGTYYSPRDPDSATVTEQYESGTDIPMGYVRQWLVQFMCESTVNLPFVYKDFFPYKNYVMRPLIYATKSDSQSEKAYLGSLNIYEEYADDYPEEYLNWEYGGFKLPAGYNFDHGKLPTDMYTEKPVGIVEILDYPKRLHWGSKRSASTISRGVSTAFPLTNIYDILLKDSAEINILYDQYSGKGGNLYAIMDRGVVGLLTDKAVLRDGVSDDLGVILSDSGFIQGEIIVDPFVGCPDKRWRGRAEGSIKNQQGIHIPGLVFQDHDDIYLLSGNSVASIITNNRATLVNVIKGISDSTRLTSTFDHARNELWLKVGANTYIYGFAVNNWVGEVSDTDIVSYANAKKYGSNRMVRLGLIDYYTGAESILAIYSSQSGFAFGSDLAEESPNSFVKFAVTPVGLSQFEFTDVFINSTIAPIKITASINSDLSDPCVLTSVKNVAGLYRTMLGRTAAGATLIGNTLYLQIEFTPEVEVNVGYVRTGYKKISGS